MQTKTAAAPLLGVSAATGKKDEDFTVWKRRAKTATAAAER